MQNVMDHPYIPEEDDGSQRPNAPMDNELWKDLTSDMKSGRMKKGLKVLKGFSEKDGHEFPSSISSIDFPQTLKKMIIQFFMLQDMPPIMMLKYFKN